MEVEPKFVKGSPGVHLADQALLLWRMGVENELRLIYVSVHKSRFAKHILMLKLLLLMCLWKFKEIPISLISHSKCMVEVQGPTSCFYRTVNEEFYCKS